jgi:CBS domain-containing protein
VIDEAGRPIGVVSRTDLLDYWGRRRDRLVALANGETTPNSLTASHGEPNADLIASEFMTPVVFSVTVNTPVAKVIDKILALEVRCLFVTDEHGVLVGAISVFDLLRSIFKPTMPERSLRHRTLKAAFASNHADGSCTALTSCGH